MHEPSAATEAAPAVPSPRRQVRNYLLDPGLQLRLAGWLVVVATALSAALGWLVWRAWSESSKLVSLGDPRSDEVVSALLRVEDRTRMLWIAGVLGGVLVALLVLAIVVTHRIAGPALALARTCRAVADGRLAPARPLRRGDLLVGLADEVGGMVEALRAREAEEQRRLEAAARGAPDDARAVAAQLAAEKARRLGA
jgi:methyl-accepting chemotaxis protein